MAAGRTDRGVHARAQVAHFDTNASRPETAWVRGVNAFLHHMVRNIVGSLVYVGAGKHAAGWMAELLGSRDRNKAAPTFAPEGLYLEGIEYDGKWGLPR